MLCWYVVRSGRWHLELCYVMFVMLLRVTRPSVTRRVTEFLLSRSGSVITCHSQGCIMQSSASNIQAASGIIIVKFIIRIHYGAAADIYQDTCSSSTQQHAALQWCRHPAEVQLLLLWHKYLLRRHISKSGLWDCKSITSASAPSAQHPLWWRTQSRPISLITFDPWPDHIPVITVISY